MPPETPLTSPDVLLILPHECGPDALYALAVKGYRYEATGLSGRLVFVQDTSVRLQQAAPEPAAVPAREWPDPEAPDEADGE